MDTGYADVAKEPSARERIDRMRQEAEDLRGRRGKDLALAQERVRQLDNEVAMLTRLCEAFAELLPREPAGEPAHWIGR